MFFVQITYGNDVRQHSHEVGPLEFGRGPRREAERLVLADPYVSRDQLRVEETATGLRLENLSSKREIAIGPDRVLHLGDVVEFPLPLSIAIGATTLHFMPDHSPRLDLASMMTLGTPASQPGRREGPPRLLELGNTPQPEALAYWMEQVLALQQATSTPSALFARSAQIVVRMVGLDEAMVLLREKGEWSIAAQEPQRMSPQFSRTLLAQVCDQRRTFFQSMPANEATPTASLEGVRSVVASPIFGVGGEVRGVLYGTRRRAIRGDAGVRPLEAQMVQLLAAALGSQLGREQALRSRLQFERFVSPELAAELDANPQLLASRRQEVTLLSSDLRGFTSLSERLDAETTGRLIQDVMDNLTRCILEEKGAIVDFAGDGILAMWNAPAAQSDHVLRGCRAALAMLDEMPSLNERWQNTLGSPLAIGIGLHVGEVMVGNTGSAQRLKYGPVGFAVNFACRVQSATKNLGTPLLATQALCNRLGESIFAAKAGTVSLPGVQDPVTLFAIFKEPRTE